MLQFTSPFYHGPYQIDLHFSKIAVKPLISFNRNKPSGSKANVDVGVESNFLWIKSSLLATNKS